MIRVALIGNPNVGKTELFNRLTGLRQHVGNWPGVTVEKKVGKCMYKGVELEIVDLPGTYSLTVHSIDELIARDYIVEEKPDVVIDIVDGTNLERNLYLNTASAGIRGERRAGTESVGYGEREGNRDRCG